jgi:hypothetical protein
MKKIVISAFLGVIIFMGCAGVSDIYKDLPNGYVYISESSMQKSIIFEDANSIEQQSKNYIPCKILEYKYDENYIVAKIKFHYNMECNVGFKESKRLKEGKVYYYIIDTVKNIRYGEFDTYEKFIEKIQKLHVSLSLDK